MSKRLLLADDSITIQKVIGITFANEDYQLDIVDNGDAALEKAQTVRPDLILADVYMPGKNGYELCQAVKQDGGLQGVPVLLLTGTFEPFDEDKARQAGADGWISKPFESQSLIDKVEELLAAAAAAPPVAVAPAIAEEPVVEAAAEPAVAETAFGGFEAPAAAVASFQQDVSPEVDDTPSDEPITELAEEDIWVDEGDLQLEDESFDLAEPAEPFETDEPLAAPAETTAAEATDDDIWGAVSFDEDELLAPPVAEVAPAAQEPTTSEPALAAAEEPADIWADTEEEIFDLDDVDIIEEEDLLVDEAAVADEVEPAGSFEKPFETAVDDAWEDGPVVPALDATAEAVEPVEKIVEPAAAEPVEEFIEPIEEAAEPVIPAAEPVIPAVEPVEELTEAAAPGAEPFDFAALEEIGAEQMLDEVEELPVELAEDVEPEPVFESELQAPEPVPAETDFAVSIDEQPVPANEAEAAVIDPTESVEQQTAALSEDELAAIVERVAGAVVEKLAASILEKVAWEVVPDLAESLIKEEIRKIKTAV